jgi:hypothetical protein
LVLLLVETKVLQWRHCRSWIASTTPFYTAPLAVVKDSALTSTAKIQILPLHSSGAGLVELTMYGLWFQQGDERPATKTINGTIKLKNLKKHAVVGTPLETPLTSRFHSSFHVHLLDLVF